LLAAWRWLRPVQKQLVVPGAQLVHLDIKSANVLLQDATFAVAKLADLGISKSLDQGDQYRKSWRMGAQSLCQLYSLRCLLGCSYVVNMRRSDVSLRPGAVPVRDACATDSVTAGRVALIDCIPMRKLVMSIKHCSHRSAEHSRGDQ